MFVIVTPGSVQEVFNMEAKHSKNKYENTIGNAG